MKNDMSYRAVKKAGRAMQAAMKRLKAAMPYGPTKVQMSQVEFRKQLEGASGQQLVQYMEQLGGEEAILAMLRGQYGRQR